MRHRREPRPLAGAVTALADSLRPATGLAAVQAVWPEAVGEAIAREATPIAERSGVVTVACRSGTWAEELDLLSQQILLKIRRALPSGTALEGLRFTASGNPGDGSS